MRAVQRHGVLWLALVLAVCAGWPVAKPALAAEDPVPTGQLWTKRPVPLWDGQAVGKGDWASLLDRKLDLSRRGKAGETRRYRIRRENLMYDRIGQPLTRTLTEGLV